MARYPLSAEVTVPTARAGSPAPLAPCCSSSRSSNTPAAPIAGIPSRNENRAAASRVNPRNIAAVMVVPERDDPGINATACARPINWLSHHPICLISRRKDAVRSANHRRMPRIIRLAEIT